MTIAPNPFEAQSGSSPRIFAGRKAEQELFREKLELAGGGKSEHLVVLGDWGIGKTTLLKAFKQIAQKENSSAALLPITDDSGSGLRMIPEELQFQLGFPKPGKAPGIGDVTGVSIAGFGASVSPRRRSESVSYQVFLTEYLRALWKHVKGKGKFAPPPIVVLLDDVQNFRGTPGAIDTLRAVLSREEIAQETRYLFVLAATPASWDAFQDRHHPIGRFFRTRIRLGDLSEEESALLVRNTLKGTGVAFDEKLVGLVHAYSHGHPYEVQLLCASLYERQKGGRVREGDWDAARRLALRELGESHFDAMLRTASDQERAALRVLAELGDGALSEIKASMPRVLDGQLPGGMVRKLEGNLNQLLARLVSKGLVQKPGRARYEIQDLMFRDYVREVDSQEG